MGSWPDFTIAVHGQDRFIQLGEFLMGQKPWRHQDQLNVRVNRKNRAARIERSFGPQWKNRIFAQKDEDFDVYLPVQLLPVGEQDMPTLRVLVQPMFQQHYIYFMAHRYFNENMMSDPDSHLFDILCKFTMRYSNPHRSEIDLLNKFYPSISDQDELDEMTLADCAVRLLIDAKTWERPTDARHFSKAAAFAKWGMPPSTAASSGSGRLTPLTDM